MTFTTEDRINAEKHTCKWIAVRGVYDDFWSTSCNQLIPAVNVDAASQENCLWCSKPMVKISEEKNEH
jgi:hypothetical protein